MKLIVSLLLCLIVGTIAYSQELNTAKLDELFNSLEKRNEAMGSITVLKNGKILYKRAIGHRFISKDIKIDADIHTNYKIWSITKTYTATMILQLIEEGKLTLETTLDRFYPQISNAKMITIKQMLNHKSGIHDFANDSNKEDWTADIEGELTSKAMIQYLSEQKPNFYPGKEMRYSNSNYLLLGYIIEEMDGNLYEDSLSRRISSKIGLTSTYFGVGVLDTIENKAYAYQFNKKWNYFEEGGFSGLIPAGAGGIVSTSTDMAKFIEAVFTRKLISENTLSSMMNKEDSYGLGIMEMPFHNSMGYGHTGGYIASESSLTYYPKDSLAIAYATNGIVIRKEEIIDHVLNIYHNKPFAVSMNRKLQAILILSIALFIFVILKLNFKSFLNNRNLLLIGYAIVIILWAGIFISGFLHGDYSHIKDSIHKLSSFYSNSGTFMASVQLIIAVLSMPFLIGLYKTCKKMKISFLPILPIFFMSISMAGSSLFPSPSEYYPLFANIILIITIGPLLAIILWSNKLFLKIRLVSVLSLILMVGSIALILNRRNIYVFVNDYFGVLYRIMYFGWTLWLVSLSFYFINELKKAPIE